MEFLGLSGQPTVWLPPKWLLQITRSKHVKHDLKDVGTRADKQQGICQGQSQIQPRQPCKPWEAESASSASSSSEEAGTRSSSLPSNDEKSSACSKQQRLGDGVDPRDPEDRYANSTCTLVSMNHWQNDAFGGAIQFWTTLLLRCWTLQVHLCRFTALDKAFMASGGKSMAMAILAQKSKATAREASSEPPLRALLKGHGGKEVIENRPAMPNTRLIAATRGLSRHQMDALTFSR